MPRVALGLIVTVAVSVVLWWRLELSALALMALLGLVGGISWLLVSRGSLGREREPMAPSHTGRPTSRGKRGRGQVARTESRPDESADQPESDPVARADDVWCTAFSPATCAPGDTMLVQVFAHHHADASTVRGMAVEFDPSATARGTTPLQDPVERGQELTFCLAMKGAVVEPAIARLVWHGEPAAVQFSVTLPEALAGKNLVGTIYVTQGSVPCGHLKFVIQVAGAAVAASAASAARPVDFTPYRTAFVSYASPDRTEVLKRVQMLPRLSIRFFQDLLSLDPGARWESELYRHIDDSDVFFLFWSTHAKNSAWVMREVNYAIARKGGDDFARPEIVPIIIEGPPPVPPPPELAHLHFNDTFIYFMQSGPIRPRDVALWPPVILPD